MSMSDTASPIRHPVVWLRNKFLAGLALVVPLIVTFWILRFVYEFLQGMSTPLLLSFAKVYNQIAGVWFRIDVQGEVFGLVTSLVGFLIPILFLVALGVMATNVIGVRVVSAMDKLLLRIPVLSFIYKSLKQVIESFRGLGDTRNFKRVVYIEYPSPGMQLIGFVTGQFIDEKTKQNMTLVFLPGALSPMTGLLIVAETHRLVDAPLTLEEGMKIVFSGGLIGPDQARVAIAPAKSMSRQKKTVATVLPAQNDYLSLPKAEEVAENESVELPPEELVGTVSEEGFSSNWKD
jgi:uncharacterized membrane protein